MSVWTAQQMRTLARMREGFLAGTAGASDYWTDEETLSLYERTFAQRIGWKWDAVLGELELRQWRPPSARLVDWGCGTGVAGLRALAHWPGGFSEITVSDRSSRARVHAHARLREWFPGVEVKAASPESVDCEGAVVLLSHVLSELEDGALRALLGRLQKAAAVVWVESATHANARRLVSGVREPLLAGGWGVVAPCTHSGVCPLLRNEQYRHWCHHFARVPSEVHQDPAWREISERLNLDLRVLPYSFVVLEREAQPISRPGGFRVIGTPREFKGHLKVLACDEGRVEDWMLQKRDAPELYKELRKGERVPLHWWRTEGKKIVEGAASGEDGS